MMYDFNFENTPVNDHRIVCESDPSWFHIERSAEDPHRYELHVTVDRSIFKIADGSLPWCKQMAYKAACMLESIMAKHPDYDTAGILTLPESDQYRVWQGRTEWSDPFEVTTE
ncbi:hypothetical protein ACXWTF_12725 [Thiomicrolovo sp. ZZH C-3]